MTDLDELATMRSAVRTILADGTDTASTWKNLTHHGFGTLALEEVEGLSTSALVAGLAQETGRALSAIPFLSSSVLTSSVLHHLGRAEGQLAERLRAGEVGVLAAPLGCSVWTGASIGALDGPTGWQLNGVIENVLDAPAASYFLVLTHREGADASLLVIDADSPGVSIAAIDSADSSRALGRIEFSDASAQIVASGAEVQDAVAGALALGTVAMSAELIGAAESFLEQTVEYVKQRWAFGRPVGSFQAVKHAAVDLFAEIAHAKALLDDASAIVDAGSATIDVQIAVSIAKVQASRALAKVATRGMLLHGAIGFTWELGAHRYTRRSLTDRLLLGDDDELVRQVAAALTAAVPDADVQDQVETTEAAWLRQNAPHWVGPRDHVGHFAVLTEELAADQLARARQWERAKSDAGYAGIAVPTQYGGQGRSQFDALTFQASEHAYDLPHWIFAITHGMILPTIVRWGTEEQKERFVPRMLDGSELWCQLFSEPGAGSDLAMASTKAVRVEGGWKIQGQKVWNSGADNSDLGLLVARTDPSVPKHQGLTVFIVPMDAPGVTVRPIVQASGSALFCEVFLDDVFIPDGDVVGEVGQGWRVAITTLMNERVALTGDGVPFHGAFALAREHSDRVTADVGVQLVDLYALHRGLQALSQRMLEGVRQGAEPGPEGSVNKLLTGRAALALADLVGRLLGPDLLSDADWHEYVIGCVGLLIGGGTEEIQKNVLAERVLGLPPEPRPKTGQSWAQEKAQAGGERHAG